MNIQVEHIDSSGITHSKIFSMSRLAFIKHLAIAGQEYTPQPQKFFRSVGMFLHYSYYIQRQTFKNNRFSEPPVELSDPTAKEQFSNLAGKAIADFLSKQIDGSLFTVSYEEVMRLQGQTPSESVPGLVAYTPTAMIAIEAKGSTQNNAGNMATHKTQAQGPVKVNFSVACVSYDLFNQVTCNYHDSFNGNVPYDNDTLRAATKNYYSDLSGFLDLNYLDINELEYQGEKFYSIGLSLLNYEKRFSKEFPFLPRFWFFDVFEHYRPRLILPRNIKDLAQAGLSNESKPFILETSIDDNSSTNTYIDRDRVGLQLRGE
jgi:hypothetical protein